MMIQGDFAERSGRRRGRAGVSRDSRLFPAAGEIAVDVGLERGEGTDNEESAKERGGGGGAEMPSRVPQKELGTIIADVSKTRELSTSDILCFQQRVFHPGDGEQMAGTGVQRGSLYLLLSRRARTRNNRLRCPRRVCFFSTDSPLTQTGCAAAVPATRHSSSFI